MESFCWVQTNSLLTVIITATVLYFNNSQFCYGCEPFIVSLSLGCQTWKGGSVMLFMNSRCLDHFVKSLEGGPSGNFQNSLKSHLWKWMYISRNIYHFQFHLESGFSLKCFQTLISNQGTDWHMLLGFEDIPIPWFVTSSVMYCMIFIHILLGFLA